MGRSVNKVILLGHLGRDAETTFTPSGVAVTKFSVATSRRWKDQQTNDWKEETSWSNVVLWRQEKVATYLVKGTQVYLEGRLQTRSYEGKDGKKQYVTEVICDEVILLGGKSESAGGTNERGDSTYERNKREFTQATGGAKDPYEGMGVTDDDIPF